MRAGVSGAQNTPVIPESNNAKHEHACVIRNYRTNGWKIHVDSVYVIIEQAVNKWEKLSVYGIIETNGKNIAL